MICPITSKAGMYHLLAAGRLGNTIPQFFDLADWRASADYRRFETWGVRTLSPGGPCRLYCPRAEVESTAEAFGCPVNVSCMIDAVLNVTAWLEVWDSPTGLIVEGIEHPLRGLSWRQAMPDPARRRTWTGIAARMILRRHLNPNSLADLESLIELYPDHVVELSACEGCFGTVPGRNAVVWECRQY